MCNLKSFQCVFFIFLLFQIFDYIIYICSKCDFINYQTADRWLKSTIFLVKKISFKHKSLYSYLFICNDIGQQENHIKEDIASTKLDLSVVTFFERLNNVYNRSWSNNFQYENKK